MASEGGHVAADAVAPVTTERRVSGTPEEIVHEARVPWVEEEHQRKDVSRRGMSFFFFGGGGGEGVAHFPLWPLLPCYLSLSLTHTLSLAAFGKRDGVVIERRTTRSKHVSGKF